MNRGYSGAPAPYSDFTKRCQEHEADDSSERARHQHDGQEPHRMGLSRQEHGGALRRGVACLAAARASGARSVVRGVRRVRPSRSGTREGAAE